MKGIPDQRELREIIEDRLEAATGEPRHVTDVEIDFDPEPNDDRNWSVNSKCKSEYVKVLDAILDRVETEFPVIRFG
jgi:hypothetical protein